MIEPDGQLRILELGIGCLVAEIEDESLVERASTAKSLERAGLPPCQRGKHPATGRT